MTPQERAEEFVKRLEGRGKSVGAVNNSGYRRTGKPNESGEMTSLPKTHRAQPKQGDQPYLPKTGKPNRAEQMTTVPKVRKSGRQ